MDKNILDTQHRKRERKNIQQCLSQLRRFINDEYKWYQFWASMMRLCFGAEVLALTGCATLFLMQLVFDMSGLELALLTTVGAIVVFGSLGVLALWRMKQIALNAAADLLKAQTNQSQRSATLNQNRAAHIIRMTPMQQMNHENIQEYQMN